jgi:hypothetical protein
LGLLYTRLGKGENARLYYREALRPYLKSNTRAGVIFTLEGIASLSVSECQWEKAAKLIYWATKERQEKGEVRPPIEQASLDRDLAIIRDHLTGTEFARFAAEGNALTMDQSITLALEED